MQAAVPAAADYNANASVAQRDGRLLINGTLTDSGGVPVSNMDMYLRLVDPEDPSSYVPTAERHRYDNGGALFGFRDKTNSFGLPSVSNGWQQITTDAGGSFSAVVQMIVNWAGDNIVVQGAAIPLPYFEGTGTTPSRCTATLACTESGVITNWRRVYLETDEMFIPNTSTFLTRDLAAGATTVYVGDQTPFNNASNTNKILAILIHGSPIDGANNYMESVWVTKAQNNKLTLLAGPSQSYQFAMSIHVPTLYAGDAIARYDGAVYPDYVSRPIDWYKGGSQTCNNPPACDTSYVDFVELTHGLPEISPTPEANKVPHVPYIANCSNGAYCHEVFERFFDANALTQRNHIHVVSATTPDASTRTASGVVADTCKDNDWQCPGHKGGVFIWITKIRWCISGGSPDYNGLLEAPVVSEITAHELGHTFDVNPPVHPSSGTATLGHCDLANPTLPGGPQASNGTGRCLMNTQLLPSERGDNVWGFHIGTPTDGSATDPWVSSEYRRIRARTDPVPNTWQNTATPQP